LYGADRFAYVLRRENITAPVNISSSERVRGKTRVTELQRELAFKIARFLGSSENLVTAVPKLTLHQRTVPTAPCPATYEPGVIVVAQGRKEVKFGSKTYIYDPSHYLLTSIDLPTVSRVVDASDAVPCLAFALKIDIAIVREFLGREEFHIGDAQPASAAMCTSKTTAEFLNACCRLVDLIDAPEDIPFLSGFIEREIIYRILRGPEGGRLRAIATVGHQNQRTAKAIAWIKANYSKPLRMEELAEVAGMAVSTLHHHFRALTTMSPLQYHKQLRLQAARARMLTDDVDAATVAFEVGYESASQFNREYSRFFGQPPIRDIKALLSPDGPKVELVSAH